MELLIPRPSLLPIIAREALGGRTFPREPEPDLVMNDPAQVKAYSDAGRIDGTMSAAYLFHTAVITQAIVGCREVIDLGCGPATQLAQVAQLNPDVDFLGVDLSGEMLASAKRHVDTLGLSNVRFLQADVTTLEGIGDRSADAVISTLALHHLPSKGHLEGCFTQVARILRPGGALYLADFCRLKSLRSVLYFAYMNAKHQPHVFSLDYERSLRAAFLAEEIEEAARRLIGTHLEFVTTFLIPLLGIVRTAPKPLTSDQRSRLAGMREELPRRYRKDLDELRLFFRLGGFRLDPFDSPAAS